MFRFIASASLIVSLTALPVYAADTGAKNDNDRTLSPALRFLSTAESAAALAAESDRSLSPAQFRHAAKRPAALSTLYVSLATLNILDGYTTSRGLSRGAQEANPIMRGAAGNPAAFWTLKAAASIGPMLVAERLWHKNRAAAIVVMVLANSVAAAVAVNNAHVLGQLR